MTTWLLGENGKIKETILEWVSIPHYIHVWKRYIEATNFVQLICDNKKDTENQGKA
jgi:hypothetical protein